MVIDMKDKNIKAYIYSIIVVLSFILVAIGATFAALVFADVIGNKKNGDVEVKTAYVTAAFHDIQGFNDTEVKPGWSNEMIFEIVNTSNEEDAVGRYNLMFEIEKNEINDNSFVYSLEGTSTLNEKVINESSTNKVVSANEVRVPGVSVSLGSGIINTGVVHRYKLKMKFIDNGENQDYLQGKTFTGKVVAVGE